MFSNRLITLLLVAIAACVLAGCGSSSQSPTAIDTAPPAVPTQLYAERDAGQVTITWAPNTTDADFTGFRLVRTARGQETALIDTPEDVTEYADSNPVLGATNIYAVTAVDLSGNESAYATVQITIAGTHVSVQPIVSGDGEIGASDSDDGPGPHGPNGDRQQTK